MEGNSSMYAVKLENSILVTNATNKFMGDKVRRTMKMLVGSNMNNMTWGWKSHFCLNKIWLYNLHKIGGHVLQIKTFYTSQETGKAG